MKTALERFRKSAQWFIALVLAIGCCVLIPLSECRADELEKALEEIVQDLERHIATTNASTKYYVVVRSFVDSQTQKPKKLSQEIESSLVDIIIERFRDKRNIIVLERKRLEALEKEVAEEANEIHFKEGEWEKKLGKKLGAGFIITGAITRLSRAVKVRAKMIDIISGEVLASSSSKIYTDEIDPSLMSDYPAEDDGEKPKTSKKPAVKTEAEPVTPAPKPAQPQPTYPETPTYNPPAAPQASMGYFCCDQFGNRRCQLIQPVPVGSPCFCPGQGWGYSCP